MACTSFPQNQFIFGLPYAVPPTSVVPLSAPVTTFSFSDFATALPAVSPLPLPTVAVMPAPLLQPVAPPPSAPLLSQEEQDYEFARRLVLEEIEAARKPSKAPVIPPAPSIAPITDSCLARQIDADEKRKVQYKQDVELAKKLEAEEKRKTQFKKDEELAKKLSEEENRLYKAEPKKEKPKPVVSNTSMNVHQRNHMVNVHNRYCGCGNVQTYNNNHLMKIHVQYCNCNVAVANHHYSPNNSNHGRKHQHDHRCCAVNHIHSESCYCAYRQHKHGFYCCNLNHTHNELCHCSDK